VSDRSRAGTLSIIVVLTAGVIGVVAVQHGWVAIALPLALGGAVVVLVYPVAGLFLLAATIPLEAALMIQGRSMAALIGIGVFGAWAAQKLMRREPLPPLVSPGLVQLSLLFLAFACLSLMWADYPAGMDRRLILLLQLILLSILVLDLASSWDRVRWVAKILVLATTAAALLTIEQSYLGGARRAGEGVVGGINRTAMTLVLMLPFAFYLLRSKEAPAWRFLGLAYIGFAGLAVAATLSRMNFLLYPLVILVHLGLMTTTRAGRRRVLLLSVATVLTVSFLPMDTIQSRAATIAPYLTQSLDSDDPSETHTARGYHLRVSFAMFQDHPILGVGYQNYNNHYLDYQWQVSGAPRFHTTPRSPHNSHIAFLANLGIIGFLLWQGLFWVAVAYLWRSFRLTGDDAAGGTPAILVQALGMAVALLFVYGFYSEIHLDKLFWVLLGLTAAVYRLSVSDAVNRRTPPQSLRVPVRSSFTMHH
jgi:O-antigen ligase